ncbi:MAG: polymer-forming cytoskeletal protein [Chloroflexota bacterium]|nr:polymer-forming cytoskeletal protein [Chloroflexota bacterium]
MSFFGGRRQEPPPAPPPPQRLEPAPAPPPMPQSPVGFDTVLGANSVSEGTLRSNANVRLDGTFSGTLEITGNVLVGETARITADINARNISIAGAVRGNITGRKVQLLRTGRIWGDIHAQALTTEEGAFIDGKITMTGQEQTSMEGQPASEPQAASEPVAVATVEEPAWTEASPASETSTSDEPDFIRDSRHDEETSSADSASDTTRSDDQP